MALGDAVQPQAVQSYKVVLDFYGFLKGWLIATSLWGGLLLLVVTAFYVVPGVRSGTDDRHV